VAQVPEVILVLDANDKLALPEVFVDYSHSETNNRNGINKVFIRN
jgi:hypothetical protein